MTELLDDACIVSDAVEMSETIDDVIFLICYNLPVCDVHHYGFDVGGLGTCHFLCFFQTLLIDIDRYYHRPFLSEV